MEEDAAADLKVRLADTGVRVAAGMEGLLEAAALGQWLPGFIAAAVVVLLHSWKRNVLASIAGGTAVYMLLVQLVFA